MSRVMNKIDVTKRCEATQIWPVKKGMANIGLDGGAAAWISVCEKTMGGKG